MRFRSVYQLAVLVAKSPATVWHLAERLAAEEQSRGVLGGLIARTCVALATIDPARVTHMLETVLGRVPDSSAQVRKFAFQLLADLHLEGLDPRASEMVLAAAERPDSQDAEVLIHQLRPLMLESGSPKEDERRRRAHELMNRTVGAAAFALPALLAPASGSLPPEEIERGRALVRCLEACAREIYFASGAYDAKHPGDDGHARTDPSGSARFLDEIGPALERLASTALAPVVHSVVETLEHLLRASPRKGFELFARAIIAGKDGGYPYDSLAVDVMVRIVSRFLAEHRGLLQDDPELQRAILDVLDIFVRVGWPQAQDITYGLHDIFR